MSNNLQNKNFIIAISKLEKRLNKVRIDNGLKCKKLNYNIKTNNPSIKYQMIIKNFENELTETERFVNLKSEEIKKNKESIFKAKDILDSQNIETIVEEKQNVINV